MLPEHNAAALADDFRWLIEAPGQRYLAARKLGNYEFHWTQDHDAAIAFRSEAQADMTMMAIRDLAPVLFDFERTIGNAKAIEHGWINTRTPMASVPTPETLQGIANAMADQWAAAEAFSADS